MRVAYFGTWERGYPRNDQVIAALESAGVDVDLVHEEMWAGTHKFGLTPAVLPRLAARRAPTRASTRCGSTPRRSSSATPATSTSGARSGSASPSSSTRWCRSTTPSSRIASASETARSLRQRYAASTELAFRAADLVVADTRANADFMCELAGIDEVAVCYLGAEERLFRPLGAGPTTFTSCSSGSSRRSTVLT